MKKTVIILLALTLIISLAACGEIQKIEEPEEDTQIELPLRVALLVNGTLGDLPLFKSAYEGLQELKEEMGEDIEVEIIEMTMEETNWTSTLYDYSKDGNWDIIIVGSLGLVEPLKEVAPQYPEQNYIIFDQQMDYGEGDLSNVYSITYKQNESAFLVGALASIMTESSQFEKVNPEDKTIGFIGGTDSPVINDFLVGYIHGAKYINEDIKVSVSYVGNFVDVTKARDIALKQYQNSGVDVGFNAAGKAGLGQFDAALEMDKYAIGVDTDQAVKIGEPIANQIPTSAVKNVDDSIVSSIKLHINGELNYGKGEILGLKENGVSLVENQYYEEIVPKEIRNQLEEIKDRIINGEIEVDTAFGKTNEEIQTLIDSVK